MASVATPGTTPGAESPAPADRVTAFLFDMDGTLAETDSVHFVVFREVLAPLGVDCTDEFFRTRISGKANSLIWKEVVPHLSAEEAEGFFRAKEERFREVMGTELKPLEGLEELLSFAEEKGIRVACVTNAPRGNAEMFYRALRLERYVKPEHLILGEECKEPKPSPIPYLTAMEKLGVQKEQCIVFEDSPTGVASAVAAGVLTVGLLTTQSREVLHKHGAQCCVRDFSELNHEALLWRRVEEMAAAPEDGKAVVVTS